MFFGTPYITETALAGTPLAMKAMPGPLPMPMSMLSAVSACCILASPAAADASIVEAVLGENPGLDADVERREGPGERHRLADAKLLRRARGRHRQHSQTPHSIAPIILRMASSSMAAPPRLLAGIITENGNLCHAS